MAKRVLIYTNHFAPEHFKINEIAEWFLDFGFHVHVVTGLPNYPNGKIFKGYGLFKNSIEIDGNLSIRRLPLFPRGRGTKLRLILNYLSYFISTLVYTVYLICFKKKYDWIFVHHTSPFFIVISAAFYEKVRRSRAILWELDLWPESLEAVGAIKSKTTLKWIEKCIRIIYKNFETILVGSKSFKAIVSKRVLHKNVFYFPNWAEQVLEKNYLNSSSKYDFDKDALKIMYTGNIGTAQDFMCLCDVILEEEINNVQWIFVGEGRFKSEMKERLKKEMEINKVVFISQQELEFIPTLVSQSDFLYLSLNNSKLFSQTVPAKLQGYMALGKPILGMISGEGASIIAEANCGFSSPPGNKTELSKMIRRAVNTNEEERLTLGKKARAYYQKNFSSVIRKKQLSKLFLDY